VLSHHLLGGREKARRPQTSPGIDAYASFEDYVTFLRRDDWNGVAELMVASAEKLADIGADFLICPDNTIH